MEKNIKKEGEKDIQDIKRRIKEDSLNRNLDNFKKLTNIEDKQAYSQIFDNFKLNVILQCNEDGNSINKNDALSASIFLNIVSRFLSYISFKGNYKLIQKTFPMKSFANSLESKNFDESPDLTIVFGNRRIESKKVYYVTSSGWSIYISKLKPCNWDNFLENPLSALYVGSFMAGEIYKILLKDYVSTEILDEFIYDFITFGQDQQPVLEPEIPEFFNIDLTLIGCGAVGQAIGLALKELELRGNLNLIDNEAIEPSNLQRYPLAFEENVGHLKTELLAQYIIGRNNLLLVTHEINTLYRVAKSDYEILNRMNDVIISVDNKKTRIDLQASLPKMIWNVWTDTSRNNLRYGFGKHDFQDEFECLACAYYPDEKIPDQIELNAKILGLTPVEINQRIKNNELFKQEDLNYVFENFTVPPNHINNLKSLVGKPFEEALHGKCGIFNVKLSEKHEPTPAPHIPTLAGVLVVIYYILSKINPTFCDQNIFIGEYDAFSYPNKNCMLKKKKNDSCVCNDEIYQQAYNEKWLL